MNSIAQIFRKSTALLIDADDTIWFDHRYFKRLRSALVSTVISEGLDSEAFRRDLKATLAHCGSGEWGFADAVMAVAARCFRERDDLMESIRSAITGFLDHPIELLPGAAETLKRICSQHRVVILTKGITEEQERKLRTSKILDFVPEWGCVEHKSISALPTVLRDLNLSGSSTASVGNSVLHDVIPAIEYGLSAIWLNHFENDHGRNAPLPSSAIEVVDWWPIYIALEG